MQWLQTHVCTGFRWTNQSQVSGHPHMVKIKLGIVESLNNPYYKSIISPYINIYHLNQVPLQLLLVRLSKRSDHQRLFTIVFPKFPRSRKLQVQSRYGTQLILHNNRLPISCDYNYPIILFIDVQCLFPGHPFKHTHVGS